MYGTSFAAKWSGLNPDFIKNEWARGLSGMTLEDLERGIRNCPPGWPPDLPQFVGLCKKTINYEALFHHAVKQMHLRQTGEDQWVHAAVFWAAQAFGTELSMSTYQQIKKRWETALKSAYARVASGDLPSTVEPRHKQAPQLAAPGKTLTDIETSKQRLAVIKAMLKK